MSTSTSANGNGVWKWVAAIVVAIMLAGAPGIYEALHNPNRAEFDLVRERQQLVLQRLAVLDEEISVLQTQIAELHLELQRHEDQTTRRQG